MDEQNPDANSNSQSKIQNGVISQHSPDTTKDFS